MDGAGFVILDIQHPEHPIFDLERDGYFSAGLGQGFDVSEERLAGNIGSQDLLSGFCHGSNDSLAGMNRNLIPDVQVKAGWTAAGLKMESVIFISQSENRNEIKIEGLLNQTCHLAAEFFQV